MTSIHTQVTTTTFMVSNFHYCCSVDVYMSESIEKNFHDMFTFLHMWGTDYTSLQIKFSKLSLEQKSLDERESASLQSKSQACLLPSIIQVRCPTRKKRTTCALHIIKDSSSLNSGSPSCNITECFQVSSNLPLIAMWEFELRKPQAKMMILCLLLFEHSE